MLSANFASLMRRSTARQAVDSQAELDAPFSADTTKSMLEGAEAEAKHKPTGLTKLADQAGTVRHVRARAGRLAGLGAAK